MTHLVFPYRGVYVRHLGGDDAVAEANQVLFFNAGGELSRQPSGRGRRCQPGSRDREPLLRELAPREQLSATAARPAFRRQRLRIDPRAQALVALLRHSLIARLAEIAGSRDAWR